jgi:oligosaccharyltransferase complex subunit gamma
VLLAVLVLPASNFLSREFDPAFNAVAKAWSSVSATDRDQHFFATLDFDNAPSVFQKLSLASAPVVFAYPATDGPRKPASGRTAPTKYDFQE